MFGGAMTIKAKKPLRFEDTDTGVTLYRPGCHMWQLSKIQRREHGWISKFLLNLCIFH